MSPAFNKVVTVLARSEGVEPPNPEGRGFGSCALKVRGKIFAMEVRGALVVKLPKARVESLVADGTGSYFDPGHGRLMKQWVSVEPDAAPWLSLAKEAYAFVR
ncbi:MAG: MmcQ/YjbR family DNA-binding protein [Polyangiaceae bacterium]|nr:MmcQ/YjbR family DNA-binding protein [Polyangiaceae bacterium]